MSASEKQWRLGKLARIETALRKMSAALAELEQLRRELSDGGEEEPRRREGTMPLEVVATVAAALGSSVREAVGGRRFAGAIRARHASALALRRLGLSYPHIAEVLGMGDHASAMNACGRAVEREQQEPAFEQAVAAGVIVGRERDLPAPPMQRALGVGLAAQGATAT